MKRVQMVIARTVLLKMSVNIDSLERDPQQNKRGRKRVSDKNKWLKNKAKLLENSGQAYVSMSKSKKEVPEKKLKPPCDDRSNLKCSQKITHEFRQDIFNYCTSGN